MAPPVSDFATTIDEAYATEGAAIDLGRGIHDGSVALDAVVKVPLRMMNRHGLIAGATGTGKTITLQMITEQLSDAGVAVFAADVKGDVSGLAAPAEAGDLDKPKLVFFFDEAHLLFGGATKAFLESVTQTVRLIRSKGVGVFFVTQVPDDVPGEVLGQLGNRVQHAVRAFTPDDAKALKAAASTYPSSDFYEVEELLTQMGIGEAAVTILSEDGVPTPVVHTKLRAPAARMGPADDVDGAAKASPLFAKYGAREDAESAREKLAARIEKATVPEPGAPKAEAGARKAAKAPRKRKAEAPTATTVAKSSAADMVGEFLTSREGKALQKKVMRGVFGMLKKGL